MGAGSSGDIQCWPCSCARRCGDLLPLLGRLCGDVIAAVELGLTDSLSISWPPRTAGFRGGVKLQRVKGGRAGQFRNPDPHVALRCARLGDCCQTQEGLLPSPCLFKHRWLMLATGFPGVTQPGSGILWKLHCVVKVHIVGLQCLCAVLIKTLFRFDKLLVCVHLRIEDKGGKPQL